MKYIIVIGVAYIVSLAVYKFSVNKKFRNNRIKYGQHNPHPKYISKRKYRKSSQNDAQAMLDYHNQYLHRQSQLHNDEMMNYMMWMNMHNK